MGKGDTIWITNNLVLGWSINTVEQVLALPKLSKEKFPQELETVPKRAVRVSKRKFFRLIGIICSSFPVVSGLLVMFSRIQNALRTM